MGSKLDAPCGSRIGLQRTKFSVLDEGSGEHTVGESSAAAAPPNSLILDIGFGGDRLEFDPGGDKRVPSAEKLCGRSSIVISRYCGGRGEWLDCIPFRRGGGVTSGSLVSERSSWKSG